MKPSTPPAARSARSVSLALLGLLWCAVALTTSRSLRADQFLDEDLPPPMFGLDQQGPDAWPFFAFNGKDRMDADGLPAYTMRFEFGPWLGWQGGEFHRDPVYIPDPLGGATPLVNFDGNEHLPPETNLLPYVLLSVRPFANYPINEFNIEYTEAAFKPRPSVARGRMEGQHIMAWYRLRLIRTSWLEAGLDLGWSFFYARAKLLTDVDAFGNPVIENLIKRINNPVIGISGRIPFSDTFQFVYEARGNPVDIRTRILRANGGFDWQVTRDVGIKFTYEYLWIEFYEDYLYFKATVQGPMVSLTFSY
ncbi:MAG: hypothetical protein ACREJ2_09305 [Planctomycetota bacterium]